MSRPSISVLDDHPFPLLGEHPFPFAGSAVVRYSKSGGFAGIHLDIAVLPDRRVIINNRKDLRYLKPAAMKQLQELLADAPGYQAPISDWNAVDDGFHYAIDFERTAIWSDGSSDVPKRLTKLQTWLDGYEKHLEDGPAQPVPENKEWYAWIDLEPPAPDDLNVTGKVCVPNPGVKAVLSAKVPQGINPSILLLDLHLIQEPGPWPDVVTWAEVRFHQIVQNSPVKRADVYFDGKLIAKIKVDQTH